MAIVTKAAYIAEMNRRLKLHKDYKIGMVFTWHPADGPVHLASGYNWLPETPGNPHPFAAIAHELIDEGWGISDGGAVGNG